MPYYTRFSPDCFTQAVGHKSCVVLDVANGCLGECLAGISQYEATDYPEAQTHTYQEGFYVIEGSGYAMIDGEEFPIEAGMSFLAPAGKKHSLRRDEKTAFVRVFWFHSA